jgi:hypothetical protein
MIISGAVYESPIKMVIVHEIRDEDEDFDSQLVDDYTTDDGEQYEEYEDEEEGYDNEKTGLASYFVSFIPLRIRSRLSIWSSKALSASLSFAKLTGKAAWILTTSLLLVGLPLLYAYDREKSLVEYEKEQERFAPPIAQ